MSSEEQSKARTEQEIQAEYNALCAQAGQNTYQIKQLENANVRIFARFNELNSEMKAAKESAASEPKGA